MTSTAVHRSLLTSVGTFFEVFALSSIAVVLPLAAATAVDFPDGAIGVALLVPLTYAAWRAGRLSIRLEDAIVVVRNPWKDYRIQQLRAVTTGQNRSLRGVPCLAFVDAHGRAVKAIAGTIWMGGAFVERPGSTVDRLGRLLAAVITERTERIRLDVPPDLRRAVRDHAAELPPFAADLVPSEPFESSTAAVLARTRRRRRRP